jgi:hypothetical protein
MKLNLFADFSKMEMAKSMSFFDNQDVTETLNLA